MASRVMPLPAAGGDPNIANNHGLTPLHSAILNCSDATIGTMIAAGADLNTIDFCGRTLLHLATIKGSDMCVKNLIDAGANPNVDDICGITPLHLAAFDGRVTVVKTLITAGANPDVTNAAGTPLQLADEKGNKECVKALIECILTKRALKDDEWGLVPTDFDIGHLLPVVMTRDGRDAAAKLVSKLPAEKQKVLETATMCMSRFVSRDVAEQILVRCV